MKYEERAAFEQADAFGIGAPNDAYAQYFVGDSFLHPLTDPKECPVFMANVTFEPGCRKLAYSSRRQRWWTDPCLYRRRGCISGVGQRAADSASGGCGIY